MEKERKQTGHPKTIKVISFSKYSSITFTGHPLTFSKIMFAFYKEKSVFQHHFPLQGLRLQTLPGQAMLWPTSCLEKKVMPAILSNPSPHHTPVQTAGQLNKQNNS